VKPIIVGMVQMNQRFFGQSFFPYSVALLQAHVMAHSPNPQRYLFLLPVFEIEPVEKVVEKLVAAEIVAFSTYVWNIQRSLAVAAQLKKRNPHVLIIFGGPQVPDRAEDFLRQNPQIDLCSHGPGEELFLEILACFPQRAWQGIAGLSYLDSQKSFQHSPRAPWKRDLSSLASPYLSGIFEPLLAANPKEKWTVAWETNRGCPFSCSFCDWGSATGSKVLSFPQERLEAEITWFSQHQISTIFCSDANFGILPRDEVLISTLIEQAKRTGFPTEVHTQSAKNATERVYRIEKMLAESGLSQGATLSFQSVSQQALKDIQRENISLASYQELQRRFKQDGIPTYTDLLIGVPGETPASFVLGLEQVIRGGQHDQLRFYEISLLPNAPMAQPEYRQKYQVESVWVPAVMPWGPVEPWQNPCENYELVVACYSFTRSDWAQMRILAWIIDLLYFYQRALQMPLLLLMKLDGISLCDLLASWQNLSAQDYPLLVEIQAFFQTRAAGILKGEPLYSPGPSIPGKPDKIWLSAVNLIYHGLIENQLLDIFFNESARWLQSQWRLLPEAKLPESALLESIEISRERFKAIYHLPYKQLSESAWNLQAVYQGFLEAREVPLAEQTSVFDATKAPEKREHPTKL
jgi:radical SAM superfamily enzyme YgiQ (UPF0313 family)